jgi:hypothetical protein
VVVRLACVVYLLVQVARHDDPITTTRLSWVLSRLDQRVKAFLGCICRDSVTRCPSGTAPQSRLTDAGVISSSHGLSVLPDVLVSSSLLGEIVLTTSADAFLSKVLGRVQESDTDSWRDFSLGVGGMIQYQRPEDLTSRVCVPHIYVDQQSFIHLTEIVC